MALIRTGLQNLDDARANLDRLKADGVSDERLVGMLKALSKACDPDCALSNFVDITNAMQSQGRDFDAMVADEAALDPMPLPGAIFSRISTSIRTGRP